MGFQVTEVQKALGGFDYPGTPDELAGHAASKGADGDLVDALRGLSKNSFDGPSTVMQELSADDQLGGSP